MIDPLDKVAPLIDATIEGLAKKTFRKDPIAGHKYSKMTSVVSSAYKRHGQILEAAFRETLMQFDPPFSVWEEKNFKVSGRADSLTADLNRLHRMRTGANFCRCTCHTESRPELSRLMP